MDAKECSLSVVSDLFFHCVCNLVCIDHHISFFFESFTDIFLPEGLHCFFVGSHSLLSIFWQVSSFYDELVCSICSSSFLLIGLVFSS
nr:MAG TPA: hypothetical protein [Caudoviricetes sp.]